MWKELNWPNIALPECWIPGDTLQEFHQYDPVTGRELIVADAVLNKAGLLSLWPEFYIRIYKGLLK